MFGLLRFVTHLQQIQTLISVTQEIIKAFTQNTKRNLIPEVSTSGIFQTNLKSFHIYAGSFYFFGNR